MSSATHRHTGHKGHTLHDRHTHTRMATDIHTETDTWLYTDSHTPHTPIQCHTETKTHHPQSQTETHPHRRRRTLRLTIEGRHTDSTPSRNRSPPRHTPARPSPTQATPKAPSVPQTRTRDPTCTLLPRSQSQRRTCGTHTDSHHETTNTCGPPPHTNTRVSPHSGTLRPEGWLGEGLCPAEVGPGS